MFSTVLGISAAEMKFFESVDCDTVEQARSSISPKGIGGPPKKGKPKTQGLQRRDQPAINGDNHSVCSHGSRDGSGDDGESAGFKPAGDDDGWLFLYIQEVNSRLNHARELVRDDPKLGSLEFQDRVAINNAITTIEELSVIIDRQRLSLDTFLRLFAARVRIITQSACVSELRREEGVANFSFLDAIEERMGRERIPERASSPRASLMVSTPMRKFEVPATMWGKLGTFLGGLFGGFWKS